MAKVRVEWITLGFNSSGGNENVLSKQIGSAVSVAGITTTATVAGNRPVAPAVGSIGQNSGLHARISGVEGNSIVAWGADPTASQTNGLLIMAGGVEVIPVDPGQKLSFVELA